MASGSDNRSKENVIERIPRSSGRWTSQTYYGNIRASNASRGPSRAFHSETRAYSLPRHGADCASGGRPRRGRQPCRPTARRCKPASRSRRKTRRGAARMALTNLRRKPARKAASIAREAAPRQAESCIGVVSTACIQAEGDQFDRRQARLLRAGDERLGRAAQRRIQAGAEKRRRR